MQVGVGTKIIGELTGVLTDVASAGYSLTDDVAKSNLARLEGLYPTLLEIEGKGMRAPGGPMIDGLGQAIDGLQQVSPGGATMRGPNIDFGPFVDGIAAVIKGAIDIA